MEIGLALGGGGVKGIAHLGVLECLEEAGIHIRALAGTSVGGMVGAIYTAGYRPKEILAMLESLPPGRMYARQAGDGPALMGYTGLAEALTEALDGCTFADIKIPFACTAVDTRTSQEIYLNEGRLVDAVLATIAIPGVFPPKILGEAELVDGGILDPVPVNLARQLDPHLPVVAVALNPAQEEWRTLPQFNIAPPVSFSIPAPIVEGFTRMRVGQALRIFMQSMDITARMLTEMRLVIDRPDVVIRPAVARFGMLDTVMPNELFQIGRQAAEQALPEIRRALAWPNRVRRIWRTAGPKEAGCKRAASERGGSRQPGSR